MSLCVFPVKRGSRVSWVGHDIWFVAFLWTVLFSIDIDVVWSIVTLAVPLHVSEHPECCCMKGVNLSDNGGL